MTPEKWRQAGRLLRAALERPPTERAAFLAAVCGGDAELRREVGEMLRLHQQADQLAVTQVEAPPEQITEEIAPPEPATGPVTKSLAGRNLGPYQILRELGRGGMGKVFLAQDTRLGRPVALKLLPRQATRDAERVRRFQQEARAASALNHPNILTIHEIGETKGVYYLVTEFVEGQTLRELIEHGRLTLLEVLDVALQAASALAVSHHAGIVHRDIKPENLMRRPDGYLKVLDFGIAKLTEAASASNDEAFDQYETKAGAIIGTVNYMSPEQARGLKVDARTDIFSLGVVLYELVTGQRPFHGLTTSDVIAAILTSRPLPPVQYVSGTPPALQRIIGRALVKEREQRYQTAQELVADLKALKQELELTQRSGALRPSNESGSRTRGAQVSTGQQAGCETGRTVKRAGLARRAWQIGLAGVLLVLLAVAAFFYLNRAPLLTEKDTVLLAAFTNTTGDAVFDGSLQHALAVQLGQTPFLNLLPEERVRETLAFMGRPPQQALTREVALEICQRQGLPALLSGSISKVGRNYLVIVEASNGQTGELLAGAQAEAESKEQVLGALGEATARLRAALGESLSSLRKFAAPIEQATTPSLEAFKAYSLGVEQLNAGRFFDALPLLKRAVELDPGFALAYSALASAYGPAGQPSLAAEAAERAFVLRDRVTEREKFRLSASFYRNVTGELEKAIETLELWKQMYPQDAAVRASLANAFRLLGQDERVVVEAEAAIKLNPQLTNSYANLGLALGRLNRVRDAKAVLTRAAELKLDSSIRRMALFNFAFLEGDPVALDEHANWLAGKPDEALACNWRARAAASAGQWHRAHELTRRASELAARRELHELAASFFVEAALRDAVFGLLPQTRQDVSEAFARARSNSFQGLPVLPSGALALALSGDLTQAQALTNELAQQYPKATLTQQLWLPLIHAAVELQRNRPAQALPHLQNASRYERAAPYWVAYLQGQAFLQLQQGQQAAAEFQKILAQRTLEPLSPLYPLAHYKLARAAALNGDLVQARQSCQNFFTAWQNADADLPVLHEARWDCERLR